jgi:hypothetical protein
MTVKIDTAFDFVSQSARDCNSGSCRQSTAKRASTSGKSRNSFHPSKLIIAPNVSGKAKTNVRSTAQCGWPDAA